MLKIILVFLFFISLALSFSYPDAIKQCSTLTGKSQILCKRSAEFDNCHQEASSKCQGDCMIKLAQKCIYQKLRSNGFKKECKLRSKSCDQKSVIKKKKEIF